MEGGSLKCVFYIIPNIFLNFIQTLVNNPPIVKYFVDEISIFFNALRQHPYRRQTLQLAQVSQRAPDLYRLNQLLTTQI